MKPKFLSLDRFDFENEVLDVSTVSNPDKIVENKKIHMSFIVNRPFDTEYDVDMDNLAEEVHNELCMAVEKALKLCEPNRCWVITDRKTGDQWVTTSKEEVKKLKGIFYFEDKHFFSKPQPRYNIEKTYLKQ
ncbi:MAG: hypothetical protein ACLFT4_10710 [Bacteroidales bacterium]